ncbi:hypothetical protein G210_1314 [Candida maltosa Xu316]|uniref:Uncharacterized protein n=1 Tax=Candida maltosa (strain Xu316) TaxID=1245528 RepID=M3J7X5_CANMX|nr:hypothetical protein G210_1314 [Candida maltosa Xu316]
MYEYESCIQLQVYYYVRIKFLNFIPSPPKYSQKKLYTECEFLEEEEEENYVHQMFFETAQYGEEEEEEKL